MNNSEIKSFTDSCASILESAIEIQKIMLNVSSIYLETNDIAYLNKYISMVARATFLNLNNVAAVRLALDTPLQEFKDSPNENDKDTVTKFNRLLNELNAIENKNVDFISNNVDEESIALSFISTALSIEDFSVDVIDNLIEIARNEKDGPLGSFIEWQLNNLLTNEHTARQFYKAVKNKQMN